MTRCRFVRPELVTLTLSDGDTLTVKQRLTAGEQRAAYARMYETGKVNPLQTGVAMIIAYLVDWSLVGLDGTVLPIRGLSVDELEHVLNGLDTEDFIEIKDAIEAHEQQQRATREREKKTPRSGVNGAEATSPSRSVPAGASNGSERSTTTTIDSSSSS